MVYMYMYKCRFDINLILKFNLWILYIFFGEIGVRMGQGERSLKMVFILDLEIQMDRCRELNYLKLCIIMYVLIYIFIYWYRLVFFLI